MRQATTLRRHAKRLRLDQTDAERKLWMRLRARQTNGCKFRRQHPIGRYIVDFCCPERHLVVELDGRQHATQAQADQRRTESLNKRGYQVVRFWDHEALADTDEVLQRIADAADGLRSPRPIGEREG